MGCWGLWTGFRASRDSAGVLESSLALSGIIAAMLVWTEAMKGITALLATTVLFVAGCGAGAHSVARPGETVGPPPPVRPSVPNSEPASSQLGFYANFGSGVTVVRVEDGATRAGVALDFRAGTRVTEEFAVNAMFTWGITEFRRTEELYDRGRNLGGDVTEGYGDVTDWVRDCSDEAKAFCYMGAFFAYVFLGFGYIAAGGMIVASPLASTSYLGASMTGSYHIGDDRTGGYAELGISGTELFVTDYEESIGAFGPVVGAGFRSGGFGLGVRMTWFPAGTQEDAGNNRNVLVGLITLGFAR
jgi:hypothetical protein